MILSEKLLILFATLALLFIATCGAKDDENEDKIQFGKDDLAALSKIRIESRKLSEAERCLKYSSKLRQILNQNAQSLSDKQIFERVTKILLKRKLPFGNSQPVLDDLISCAKVSGGRDALQGERNVIAGPMRRDALVDEHSGEEVMKEIKDEFENVKNKVKDHGQDLYAEAGEAVDKINHAYDKVGEVAHLDNHEHELTRVHHDSDHDHEIATSGSVEAYSHHDESNESHHDSFESDEHHLKVGTDSGAHVDHNNHLKVDTNSEADVNHNSHLDVGSDTGAHVEHNSHLNVGANSGAHVDHSKHPNGEHSNSHHVQVTANTNEIHENPNGINEVHEYEDANGNYVHTHHVSNSVTDNNGNVMVSSQVSSNVSGKQPQAVTESTVNSEQEYLEKLEAELEKVESLNEQVFSMLERNQNDIEEIKHQLSELKHQHVKPATQNHVNSAYNNQASVSASASAGAGNYQFAPYNQQNANNYHWSWSGNTNQLPTQASFPKIEMPPFPQIPPIPPMPPMPSIFNRY